MAPKEKAIIRVEGVKHAPTLKEEVKGCTDAVCGVVETMEKASGKFLKLSVNIGEELPLSIVTNWEGLDVGLRVCIAVVGSFVADVEVKPVERGGALSQGLLCDSSMLGWAGGTTGSPVLLPTSFEPGMPAPTERPKRTAANVEDPRDPSAGAEALFGPVLTKEEKKAAAATKKAEREAKKKGGGVEVDAKTKAAKPRVAPTKADLKKIKKLTADKRKAAAAGEEVFTDDELERAGFLLEGEEPETKPCCS